jgi:hypothetical protein
LHGQSIINMAAGALMVMGPVSLEQARQVLGDIACRLNLDTLSAAEHVLSLAEGGSAPDGVVHALQLALERYRP